MKKELLKLSLLTFLVVLCCSVGVLAAPTSEDVKNEGTQVGQGIGIMPEIVNIKNKEVEGKKVLTFYNGEVELFDINSETFKLLLSQMEQSILEDATKGFELLRVSDVTLDHIKLSTWGEFLNKYYGKKITSFPVGDIEIKFGTRKFRFVNTEQAREVVLDYIIPNLIKQIESIAPNYPVKRYALDITSGSLLKDYECDLSSVRLVNSILPFQNMTEYMFYNVGSYYGMSLSTDYVSVLRGYIEGDSRGYDRPVEGQYPGCVNVLSYITLLKDISNNTLSDKKLSDFMLYEDLAVCLDTKELVNTNDMTTQNKVLSYSDFKLNPDTLIIAPISDDVVILQPTYLECFLYGGYNKGLDRTVDITPFVSEGQPNFAVSDGVTVEMIPVKYFADENGRLGTELGRAPFLMYYTSHVPYDLMIDWAYNKAGSSFSSNSDRDSFVKMLKNELVAQNRKADFNAYMKAAGQLTDGTKTIFLVVFLVVVVGGIVAVVLIIKKKAKIKAQNAPITGNQTLLFDSEDNDDSDDNDDFGDFELK